MNIKKRYLKSVGYLKRKESLENSTLKGYTENKINRKRGQVNENVGKHVRTRTMADD